MCGAVPQYFQTQRKHSPTANNEGERNRRRKEQVFVGFLPCTVASGLGENLFGGKGPLGFRAARKVGDEFGYHRKIRRVATAHEHQVCKNKDVVVSAKIACFTGTLTVQQRKQSLQVNNDMSPGPGISGGAMRDYHLHIIIYLLRRGRVLDHSRCTFL